MAERRVAASLAGIVCGVAGFALMVGAGIALYQRLWGGSILALLVILVLFGAAGAYGGFLLGLLAFSAVRRDPDGDEGPPR